MMEYEILMIDGGLWIKKAENISTRLDLSSGTRDNVFHGEPVLVSDPPSSVFDT